MGSSRAALLDALVLAGADVRPVDEEGAAPPLSVGSENELNNENAVDVTESFAEAAVEKVNDVWENRPGLQAVAQWVFKLVFAPAARAFCSGLLETFTH